VTAALRAAVIARLCQSNPDDTAVKEQWLRAEAFATAATLF